MTGIGQPSSRLDDREGFDRGGWGKVRQMSAIGTPETTELVYPMIGFLK